MYAVRLLFLTSLILIHPASGKGVGQISTGIDNKQRAATLFEQGQNAHERGELATAVRLYSEAIMLFPGSFQTYYQRGSALAGLGKLKEAEADAQKTIELEPAFARAHRLLGLVLLDEGRTEASIQSFTRAILIDPKLTGVRLNLSSSLIKTGKPADAIDHLKIAIEQNEDLPFAYALLGLTEEKLGRLDEAVADYSRSIELGDKHIIAREGRARIYESRGDIPKAIDDFSQASKMTPSADVLQHLAELYRKNGQPQAATSLYRELIRKDPNNALMRLELARLLTGIKQYEEASKEIEAALKIKPGDIATIMKAADILAIDRPDLAQPYYQSVLQLDANQNDARIQLGASLVRSKSFREAIPILGDAIQRDPSNWQAHVGLATALFELKAYPNAAGEYIWLIQQRPDNSLPYYFLAICFDRAGDCGQALKAYEGFISRADDRVNKREIDDTRIRLSLLQKLVKDGKCKSPTKGKGK